MKSVQKAYWLWLFSGFGWLGLHRFYLKKQKTAALWLLTFGFFGIGSMADLIYLKWLVHRYNMLEKISELQQELEQTAQWKERLVKEHRFQEAANCRDKERMLMRQIERLQEALPYARRFSINEL